MPEPFLVAIAAALAGRSVASLYDLVKGRFSGGRERDALEAAEGAGPDSPQVAALAGELERTAAADPDFATALRAEWNAAQVQQVVDHGSVSNHVSGTVTGNVVQAKDIQGNISFGS
ncbi:hypothetical protein ACTG9Q_18950 [Actinokineospora sp. 24-640]